jgi:hypothetical protein
MSILNGTWVLSHYGDNMVQSNKLVQEKAYISGNNTINCYLNFGDEVIF